MTRLRVRSITMALAPPLVLSVACGGSGTKASGSVPAACDILTAELVAPVAGSGGMQQKSDGVLNTYPNHCTFTSPTAKIQIVIAEWSQIDYPGGDPVAGIGDEAHVAPGGILYVRKGTHGLMVAVTLRPGTDLNAKIAAEENLAPKLLAEF